MNDNKRHYVYYLLDHDFVMNDPKVYEYLRKLIYSGLDYDENHIHNNLIKMKPLTYNEELLTLSQYIRDKKLSEILK
jgi:hypothetical protein